MNYTERNDFPKKMIIGLIITFVIIILFLMFVYPMLQPFWASQTGKAELAQAEQNRQIAVLEATAKKESAIQLAQAEIERAKGVAEANQIIGDSLKGNNAYLTYLWIQGMQTNQMQVVYVPTEANLPILEADRFGEILK